MDSTDPRIYPSEGGGTPSTISNQTSTRPSLGAAPSPESIYRHTSCTCIASQAVEARMCAVLNGMQRIAECQLEPIW